MLPFWRKWYRLSKTMTLGRMASVRIRRSLLDQFLKPGTSCLFDQFQNHESLLKQFQFLSFSYEIIFDHLQCSDLSVAPFSNQQLPVWPTSKSKTSFYHFQNQELPFWLISKPGTSCLANFEINSSMWPISNCLSCFSTWDSLSDQFLDQKTPVWLISESRV